MLASEKRSLRHQKDDKQTRLQALEDEERQLSEEYETSRVYEFLDAITDELIKEDELPSLEVVMERHPDAWNLNPEILKREYEETSELRLQARQFIGQHSRSIDVSNRSSFDDWISKNRLNIAAYDREILEQEYDKFVTYEKERRAEEEEKTHPSFLGQGTFLRLPLMPRTNFYDQRRQESIAERLNNVRAEIYVLKHEVVDLDRRLASFRDPQDLRWGLCVLGYLAGVGILFPLLIIAEEAYSTIANQFAIGLFFSGLMAIVGYIVFQINRLRR
jgi:hypothetical protein